MNRDYVKIIMQGIVLQNTFTLLSSLNFAITVDNTCELYMDGRQEFRLPNRNDWRRADVVPLPSSTQLIAVKGVDHGVIAGILASSDDGSVLTNSSWKCSSVFRLNWTEVDFNDSTWSSATEIARNGEGLKWKRLISGISRDASWIWTSNYLPNQPKWDNTVYCRLRLRGSHPNNILLASLLGIFLTIVITAVIIVCFVDRRQNKVKGQQIHRTSDSKITDSIKESQYSVYEELREDLVRTNEYGNLRQQNQPRRDSSVTISHPPSLSN